MHLRCALTPVLAALFLLAVIGCRPADDASSATDAGKVLHLGNGAEPQDLDPHVIVGVPESKIVTALFEGLVAEGPNGNDTMGGVAERWEISPDELIYTFHLRPNAKWSDGEPLTAHDFIRSFQRILTPSLAAEYAYKLYHVFGAEEYHRGELTDFSQVGFSAPDNHTLVITLKHRTPFLIQSLKHPAWFPVPTKIIDSFGGLDRQGTAWTRAENLVGNGPFILKEWSPQRRVVVERSPHYWDRATVKLDQIHFHPISSTDTEERMFRTGQLHKTNELPNSKIEVYKRDFPESYREDPYYGVYFYMVNVTRPPLNDPRVRRALALTIDREAIVRAITRSGQQPAWNFVPPSESFQSRARLAGDADEARRLLAEAGFPGGEGFPSLSILFNTSENHRAIAEAIQQMWRRELGVDIGLHNQEWKVYLDSQDTLSYDLSRFGWIGDYPDPATFMDMWVTGGGNNDTGWSSPKYDALLAASQEAATDAERFEIYHQMDQLLMEELPIIPIYFYTRAFAIDPRVRWVPDILDQRNWKFVDIAD